MKVVFVGPSLPDALRFADKDICLMPPAAQGDVVESVLSGAKVVGIIDGVFEHAASVWHKEILFALSRGCAVLGASSMGALRAVECAPFGMIGIGAIFEDYLNGIRVDDGDVALQHGPEDMDFAPLTVPLVNVDATLGQALNLSLISEFEAGNLSAVARSIFFKQRTWKRICRKAELTWERFSSILQMAEVDQKREDALLLLRKINNVDPQPINLNGWRLNETQAMREILANANNRRFIRNK